MNERAEIGLKKVEILVNWQCNQRCIFCSVGHKLVSDGRAKSWLEIKKDLEFAKRCGADIISFSGGEPTIRKDLFEAIRYAKKLGFEVIEIQTNGCMLKYRNYAKKIFDLGVNRVLVSIHAPNAKLEDFLTQTKGSFDDKVAGLKNLEDLGIEKRTSTVINTYNYEKLPEMAAFLLKFKKNTKSYHLNFAIPDGFAKQDFERMVPRIDEAASYIKEACDILLKEGGKPFLHNMYPCILPSYTNIMSELTVTNTILIGPKFRADIQKNRQKYRSKGANCKKCKYFLLCVGPFKEYTRVRGFSEFKPIEGKQITTEEFKLQEY
ncbi:MAG: radical SAM protein [Candidatus Diapherotrites archaeon]|nr:radical SAM protein [Candidatus Diapherotrites archaeon]